MTFLLTPVKLDTVRSNIIAKSTPLLLHSTKIGVVLQSYFCRTFVVQDIWGWFSIITNYRQLNPKEIKQRRIRPNIMANTAAYLLWISENMEMTAKTNDDVKKQARFLATG